MKRILLKISGEALSNKDVAIDANKTRELAQMIQDIKSSWLELVIVLWGWNIYRWSSLIKAWVDPADSHNMSMLSTVFNAVTLKNFLEKIGEKVSILDPLHVEFLETYTAVKARKKIREWQTIICTCGTGSPFVTTDTGGVLRSLETHCDAMIKLTQVDGVYDSDPKTNLDAKKYDHISYDDFITQDLKVLDQTWIIMARDNNLPIYVTKLWNTQDILDMLGGKNIGTKIS